MTVAAQPQDFNSPRNEANVFAELSPGYQLLLLAFLALTSKFHPGLVAHHSPASGNRPSNPLIAADYYAAACKGRLSGTWGESLGIPSIPRIQALLMLAMHEWGNNEGSKAWVFTGIAIRYAQLHGLHYQPGLDDDLFARPASISDERQRGHSLHDPTLTTDDEQIDLESRRRTFWSCFIMDRYLSSGKFRPQMLRVGDARVQLPCSERAFLFGEKVRTPTLSDTLGEQSKGANGDRRSASAVTTPGPHHGSSSSRDMREDELFESGIHEGPVSRYVRAVDLFGEIVKWVCSGGRR